jgi:putative PIN family toxin of toxin-antitoxin system
MAAKKKVKQFVIDVNAFISIFLSKQEAWLLAYIRKNAIEIFVDQNLLDELLRVLAYARIHPYLQKDKFEYFNFVRYISTFIDAEEHHIKSPDPDDNYLYNLALTANAKLLVSNENALLKWLETPVETITLTEFKYYFSNNSF